MSTSRQRTGRLPARSRPQRQRAGVAQVVYLGGLGDDDDDLSEHLRSRREVESILLNGAPTTALRAGIVIGDGGISWEILRQLVERLPAMVTPRWVETRSQPIALVDAVCYLAGVLGCEEAVGNTYEIGGPDVLSYREMMATVAEIMGRRRIIMPVPLLSPRLSSHWLRLVTDVDLTTARALVDSMTNEVIVHDHRIDALLPHEPLRSQPRRCRRSKRGPNAGECSEPCPSVDDAVVAASAHAARRSRCVGSPPTPRDDRHRHCRHRAPGRDRCAFPAARGRSPPLV